MNTFRFPDTVVCPFLWPPPVPSHSCIFPTLSPVQPCGYSTALVLAVEHSDAVKSELCCRQLSSSSYHWLCSVLHKFFHVHPGITRKGNLINY